MSTREKLIQARVSMLALADELQNISRACKIAGIARSPRRVRRKLLPQAPRRTARANERLRARLLGPAPACSSVWQPSRSPVWDRFITAGALAFRSWDHRWGTGRGRDRGGYLGCYRRRVKPSGVQPGGVRLLWSGG
jgi:hypothetical protein